MRGKILLLLLGLGIGVSGCARNRASVALLPPQSVEPVYQQVEIPKPLKVMEFGQPGEPKDYVIVSGDIYAKGWVEADESVYSFWQKIGPGEPCEVCGLMPRVLEVQRNVGGAWVKQRYDIKKLPIDEQKSTPIKGGDIITVSGFHF